jgi:hypothetical protein
MQMREAARLLELNPAARDAQMASEMLLSDPRLGWLVFGGVRRVERAHVSAM